MFELINKLYTILNMIKEFEVGCTSRNNESFLLDYKNKRYLVSLKEIKNPSDNMLDDIDTYL